ncbi:MAG: DUF4838 domain-containing protein [Armatimonadetes bacterium]|nr:DUF4838 domain-containing protein [Armatimonadota bacterium]
MNRVLGPLAFWWLLGGVTGAAPLEIVRGGQTSYVIYHAPGAPSSVAAAAADLQQYIAASTGAKPEIVTDPREPMICLGVNDAAAKADLSVEGIPPEGYRIAARGANLYILGPDTANGVVTPGGGTSAGTRNGVSAFLERFVGVRWLMPGEHGDYVPRSADLTVPDADLADAPIFLNRRVPYTQESRPEVRQWWARQKLGWSLYLQHSHNWTAIPAGEFDAHPDWFAERGGVRVPPTGRYKLCITNAGLIRAFADVAIRYFDANPAASCYSLSPADSAGWCECTQCRALYETDPNGHLSITPAVLTFYNAVAKLVAAQHPDKLLAGYVYADYVFPPQKPIKLEPNVFLVWAPSFDYGFTLYRPELQRQWEDLAAQWTQVTQNIAYYDLPNCVHNDLGAPNPPGLKILEFLYPRLKQSKMKGVYVYGNPAWGHSAPMNYLLAKLAWDPDADAEALLDEFFEKAYEAGAPEMKGFFRLLDAETERYFVEQPTETYVLSAGRLKDVYARNFPQLEQLYLAAEAKVQDPDAKARLAMLGDNLKVLHWNLRQQNLLENPTASAFYLTDQAFFAFLSENRQSLALTPVAPSSRPPFTPGKLVARPAEAAPNAEDVQPCLLRGDQHLVIAPTGDDQSEVRFSNLTTRGKLVTYALLDAQGKDLGAGVVSPDAPVALPTEGAAPFCMVIAGGSASFQVEITNAHWAVSGRLSDQGLHLLNRVTPVYFEVPAGVAAFHLQMEADPPGETALGRLITPTGREAASFDCSAKSVDRQGVAVQAGEAGFWKLIIEKAPIGVIDDVYIQQGDELGGFFSLAPEQALSVTQTK